jgi:predicted esterase
MNTPEISENVMSFPFEGKYAQLGTLGASTREIWFVLHGYGQLARYFLRKFEPLADAHTCVIAPEGLSKFYLAGFEGRVGATWMTKDDRLRDIRNYIAYLNSLHAHVLQQVGASQVKVHVLGFSQGAATVSRWVMDGKVDFARLVLWAGVFPPDLDIRQSHQVLAGRQVVWVYGQDDPYLTDSRFTEMEAIGHQLGVQPQVISFKGGHDIDAHVLVQLKGGASQPDEMKK